MKENFIELTNDGVKILINLLNVAKIEPYEDDSTKIVFTFEKKENPYLIIVDESYDEVKKLMGLTKREVKIL